MLKGSFPRGSPPGHGLGGCDRRAGGWADPQQELGVGDVTQWRSVQEEGRHTHQLAGGLLVPGARPTQRSGHRPSCRSVRHTLGPGHGGEHDADDNCRGGGREQGGHWRRGGRLDYTVIDCVIEKQYFLQLSNENFVENELSNLSIVPI